MGDVNRLQERVQLLERTATLRDASHVLDLVHVRWEVLDVEERSCWGPGYLDVTLRDRQGNLETVVVEASARRGVGVGG